MQSGVDFKEGSWMPAASERLESEQGPEGDVDLSVEWLPNLD